MLIEFEKDRKMMALYIDDTAIAHQIWQPTMLMRRLLMHDTRSSDMENSDQRVKYCSFKVI